jgi:hypothetical protein
MRNKVVRGAIRKSASGVQEKAIDQHYRGGCHSDLGVFARALNTIINEVNVIFRLM